MLQVAEAANTIYKDSAAGEPACSPGDTNSLLRTSCSWMTLELFKLLSDETVLEGKHGFT